MKWTVEIYELNKDLIFIDGAIVYTLYLFNFSQVAFSSMIVYLI